MESKKFLHNWVKPKTTVYNNFKILRAQNQGSMNFKQYTAKVKMLMNDCNIENAQNKESII